IKQFRDMGFKQPVVGGGALYRNKLFQITGKEAENIYAMSLYNPDKNTNAYLTFKNNFKKKFNKEPDDMALIAYDGIYTLVNAIKKTDSFRTANISPILHYNYHYDGISNKFQFNEDGDLTNHNLFFYKAVNKKFERIDIDFNSLLLKKKAAIISSD
nr:ABC transporter substrate-binding protein [Candidatus Dependentiae bacterium]